MSEDNGLLRAARERMPSRVVPGECLSRTELAAAVNLWLWRTTGVRYELDDHLIGKWERGRVRRPSAPYRAALRALLGVDADEQLGFQSRSDRQPVEAPPEDRDWTRRTIVAGAAAATEWDLINRRAALRNVAALSGVGLLRPLERWLEPLADGPSAPRRGALALAEVEAVEHVALTFRSWHVSGSALGRTAVLGQLSDVAERLATAPPGRLTDRVFLAAAELAKIAGSMAFDDGSHRLAQQHYGTAVRMAKAGGHLSFGAVALAALARQSFDLGATDDGLEIVQLAQRGTRGSTTPGLRAMLATREAWGHAQRGSVHAFRRAVDTAEQAHADMDPAAEPWWLHGFDRAELAGVIGARYRDLARHDLRQARHATAYVSRALILRDPSRTRNRAFDLVSLARVLLLTGDHEHAAAKVREALPMVDAHRPGRLGRKLADWRRESEPCADVLAVRESRDAISALAADAPA